MGGITGIHGGRPADKEKALNEVVKATMREKNIAIENAEEMARAAEGG